MRTRDARSAPRAALALLLIGAVGACRAPQPATAARPAAWGTELAFPTDADWADVRRPPFVLEQGARGDSAVLSRMDVHTSRYTNAAPLPPGQVRARLAFEGPTHDPGEGAVSVQFYAQLDSANARAGRFGPAGAVTAWLEDGQRRTWRYTDYDVVHFECSNAACLGSRDYEEVTVEMPAADFLALAKASRPRVRVGGSPEYYLRSSARDALRAVAYQYARAFSL